MLRLSRRRDRPGLFGASNRQGPEPQNWFRDHQPCSYWVATRRPFPSLLLVFPLAMAYESAILWLGGTSPGHLRTGADAWLRQVLSSVGLRDPWFLPLLLVLILMSWQVVRSYDWRFSPAILAGMVLESVTWAIGLVGISRLIDIGFFYLEHTGSPVLTIHPALADPVLRALIGYVGAGVYEETLFRLILVPALFGVLRLLQTPQVPANALAVTASALLFALAHHAGTPGETFTWFAFIFRWMAGVFFAWVFVIRGFGIAVGTHTVYDMIVGWIGWCC